MKCQEARQLLPVLDQGGMAPRRGEALVEHLGSCAACQRVKAEHEQVLRLLATYKAPALPEGFGEQLNARLDAESKGPRKQDTRPLPALEEEPGRRRALRALAYLAAGLLVGALSTWGFSGPPCAAPAARRVARFRSWGTRDRHPEPRPGGRGDPHLGVRADHPDAELEVVLPDGLSLVGEGLAELEEKVLRWAEPLRPGINLIRVPVRALRPGNWVLVARARAGGRELGAQSRLTVTES